MRFSMLYLGEQILSFKSYLVFYAGDSLTNIIETRKLRKQSTFATFIDYKKSYDCINRDILFAKLSSIGISGKMYQALLSIYKDVNYCVRLNGVQSKCFSVDSGLKQGCTLSPILFNFYINDLVSRVSNLGLVIDIDDEKLSILMYTDDVVTLSESEEGLQRILDKSGVNRMVCLLTRRNQRLCILGQSQFQS